MATQRTIIFCSMSMIAVTPLIGSELNHLLYLPTSYAKLHPVTSCLLLAEIERTSPEDVLKKAEETAQELFKGQQDSPDVWYPEKQSSDVLLVFNKVFDETMQHNPVAQKIFARIAPVVDNMKQNGNPRNGQLDDYTSFCARDVYGTYTITCTTKTNNLSLINHIIAVSKLAKLKEIDIARLFDKDSNN